MQADEDAEKWIKIFTFLDQATVDSLIAEHKKDAAKRSLQKKLAEEVTKFVHGEEDLKKQLKQRKNYLLISMLPQKDLSIDDT